MMIHKHERSVIKNWELNKRKIYLYWIYLQFCLCGIQQIIYTSSYTNDVNFQISIIDNCRRSTSGTKVLYNLIIILIFFGSRQRPCLMNPDTTNRRCTVSSNWTIFHFPCGKGGWRVNSGDQQHKEFHRCFGVSSNSVTVDLSAAWCFDCKILL